MEAFFLDLCRDAEIYAAAASRCITDGVVEVYNGMQQHSPQLTAEEWDMPWDMCEDPSAFGTAPAPPVAPVPAPTDVAPEPRAPVAAAPAPTAESPTATTPPPVAPVTAGASIAVAPPQDLLAQIARLNAELEEMRLAYCQKCEDCERAEELVWVLKQENTIIKEKWQQELAKFSRMNDPHLAAQVLSSQPDALGVAEMGATDARGGADVTEYHRDLKDSVGAAQVYQMGSLKARSCADEVPVIYTVCLQNTGDKAWPATAAMVHHSGPVMDLPVLPLTELPPGACCDVFVDLTIPKAETEQHVTSTWVVRDISTGQALGPILTLVVDFQPPVLRALEGEESDTDADGQWEFA